MSTKMKAKEMQEMSTEEKRNEILKMAKEAFNKEEHFILVISSDGKEIVTTEAFGSGSSVTVGRGLASFICQEEAIMGVVTNELTEFMLKAMMADAKNREELKEAEAASQEKH